MQRGPGLSFHLGEVVTSFSIPELRPFIKSPPLTCYLLRSQPVRPRWASRKQDSFCLKEERRVVDREGVIASGLGPVCWGPRGLAIWTLSMEGTLPGAAGRPLCCKVPGCLGIFPHQFWLKLTMKTMMTTVISYTSGWWTVLYEECY